MSVAKFYGIIFIIAAIIDYFILYDMAGKKDVSEFENFIFLSVGFVAFLSLMITCNDLLKNN